VVVVAAHQLKIPKATQQPLLQLQSLPRQQPQYQAILMLKLKELLMERLATTILIGNLFYMFLQAMTVQQSNLWF